MLTDLSRPDPRTRPALDPGLQLMQDACAELEQGRVLEDLCALLRSTRPLPVGLAETMAAWLILAEGEYDDHSVERFLSSIAVAHVPFVDGLRPGTFDTRSVPRVAIESALPFIRELRCKPELRAHSPAAAALSKWATGLHAFVTAYVYPPERAVV
jgi:hypothetical protein